jgi:hypothetical protein
LEASFEGFSVKNIPSGEIEHADLLAKSAAQGLCGGTARIIPT